MKNPFSPRFWNIRDHLTSVRQPPVLVKLEGEFFVFLRPEQPHFYYDFKCNGPASAIGWFMHMAEKSWVTKEHLRQFADLLMQKGVAD